MEKDLEFIECKGDVVINLEAIELNLLQCTDEKLFDFQNIYRNDISALLEEAHDASSWSELSAIVSRAKILENDIANWLARHGRASLSLSWPKIPTKLF